MANVKISDLPAASSVSDSDEFEINQSGTSRKATLAQIRAIPDATTDASGLMSASDKEKLDGIEEGAQANTVTSVHGRTGAVVGAQGDYDGVGSNEDTVSGSLTVDSTKLNRLQRYTGSGSTWTFNSAGGPGFVPIINKGSGAITLSSGTATVEGAESIPKDKAACAIYYGDGTNVRVVVEA